MPDPCAFCGSAEPLTREHVFGRWVSKIGLDLSPVQHRAGPLNGIPRDMGEQPPFRQTVKSFCASCNNGWMSNLESTAQRVLTPLVLGEATRIAPADQGAIAMWVQKTALTAMLISGKEQRESGYGLPPAEYRALYARREVMQPLSASRFWVGRYEGPTGFWAIRVMPLTVRIPGLTEPDVPQCYLMTIVLGELALQGLRFTTSALEIETTSGLGLPQLWPPAGLLSAPAGEPCTEALFLGFADGKLLQPAIAHVELKPWTRATELPQSTIVDGKVRVPTACKKHFFYYPVALMEAALRGKFHAFMTTCECQTAYLIQTESDGAHCKAAGVAAAVGQIYTDLPGDEFVIQDGIGEFVCKEVPTA